MYSTTCIYVVKTKALIRSAVIVQLICALVLAYGKSRISHEAASQYNNTFGQYDHDA